MQNVLAALVAFAASGYIIAVTAQGSAPFVTLGQFYGTNSNSPPSFYVVVNGISFSTAIAGDATSFDTCLSSCQATSCILFSYIPANTQAPRPYNAACELFPNAVNENPSSASDAYFRLNAGSQTSFYANTGEFGVIDGQDRACSASDGDVGQLVQVADYQPGVDTYSLNCKCGPNRTGPQDGSSLTCVSAASVGGEEQPQPSQRRVKRVRNQRASSFVSVS